MIAPLLPQTKLSPIQAALGLAAVLLAPVAVAAPPPAADAELLRRIAPVARVELATTAKPATTAPAAPPPTTAAAAAAPASAPVPAPATAPAATAEPDPGEAAKALVAAWASAWSERRVDSYLAFYGKEFTPERGVARSDWEKSRRQKIASRKTISVAVRDLAVSAAGDQRLTARFVQDYSADGFSEKGTAKTLLLAREGKDWRIVGESRGSAK
jgi:hypothetical protein